jgi:hypothetical protein
MIYESINKGIMKLVNLGSYIPGKTGNLVIFFFEYLEKVGVYKSKKILIKKFLK